LIVRHGSAPAVAFVGGSESLDFSVTTTERPRSGAGRVLGHYESRSRLILEQGQEAYHDQVCAEVGVPSGETAVMGTAANMN